MPHQCFQGERSWWVSDDGKQAWNINPANKTATELDVKTLLPFGVKAPSVVTASAPKLEARPLPPEPVNDNIPDLTDVPDLTEKKKKKKKK